MVLVLERHRGRCRIALLWGPAVDQVLAEEQVTSGTSPGSVLLDVLADNQGTVRDVIDSMAGTVPGTTITYSAFRACCSRYHEKPESFGR